MPPRAGDGEVAFKSKWLHPRSFSSKKKSVSKFQGENLRDTQNLCQAIGMHTDFDETDFETLRKEF
jgi:hypothetical protein